MTVSTAYSGPQTSACDGSTTSFPVAFQYADKSGLVVELVDDASGTATTLTEGTDYTRSGDGMSAPSSITTLAVYPAGKSIRRSRATPRLQSLLAPPNSLPPAAQMERAWDRAVLAVQEIDADLGDVFAKLLRTWLAPEDGSADGKYPVVLPGGGIGYASGTGADGALREDLANVEGPSLIGVDPAQEYPEQTLGYQVQSRRVVPSLTGFLAGAGPTWPYYNLVYDRVRYGTSAAPLVTVAPADGFVAPFTRELYLGAGHEGGAEVGHFLLQVRGAPNPAATNTNQNYVAVQAYTSVTASLGGTGLTMPNSKGQLFGAGMLAVAYPGATNLRNLTGAECNVQASAGSSVAYKSCFQLVAMPDDAVQGSVYDCGLSISSQVGAVGYKHGILFSAANGKQAVASTGTLIGVADGGTAANGLDLNGYTFTANAFASNGFSVNGSGGLTALNFISTTAGAVVRLGKSNVASSVALQFLSSGATSSIYDSSITGFGGSGTQGQGGLSADCSVFQPAQDNYASLGASGKRWTQLWAATGTINTSDRNAKQDIKALSDAEFDALLTAIAETPLVAFRFVDAVAEKGDAARYHYGIIAQDLAERLVAYGLDPFAGGVVGRDPWMELSEEEYEAEEQATEMAQVAEEFPDIEDGRVVMRQRLVDRPVPVFDRLPVYEENGERRIIPAQPARTIVDPKTGARLSIPATEASEVFYSVKRMVRVTKKRQIEVRKLDARGEPAWLWNVRYDEFWALRFAALARDLAGSVA